MIPLRLTGCDLCRTYDYPGCCKGRRVGTGCPDVVARTVAITATVQLNEELGLAGGQWAQMQRTEADQH